MAHERRVKFTVCVDWPAISDEQEFRYIDLLSDPEFQQRVHDAVQAMFATQLALPIPKFTIVSMSEMTGDERV